MLSIIGAIVAVAQAQWPRLAEQRVALWANE